LVSYELDSGTVLVEVGEQTGFSRASRVGDLAESASMTLATALTQVRDAADVALRQFRGMASKPDEVQIEFGVKLTAQAGAVIAKTGLEGQLKVKLAWRGRIEDQEEENQSSN
jgi:hypothetical protein